MDSGPRPGLIGAIKQHDRLEGWHDQSVIGRSVLAIVLLFAGQQAKAEWLCGSDRCVWVSYDVDEPAYAIAWARRCVPAVSGSRASSAAGRWSARRIASRARFGWRAGEGFECEGRRLRPAPFSMGLRRDAPSFRPRLCPKCHSFLGRKDIWSYPYKRCEWGISHACLYSLRDHHHGYAQPRWLRRSPRESRRVRALEARISVGITPVT